MSGPLAGDLLVRHENTKHRSTPVRPSGLEHVHGLNHGYQRALGVASAASVELAAAFAKLERIAGPPFSRWYDIDMRVERKDWPSAIVQPGRYVDPSGLIFVERNGPAFRPQMRRQKVCGITLVPRRIFRIECDKPSEVCLHAVDVVTAHYLRPGRFYRSPIAAERDSDRTHEWNNTDIDLARVQNARAPHLKVLRHHRSSAPPLPDFRIDNVHRYPLQHCNDAFDELLSSPFKRLNR